jgi:hypothetical protein
VQERVIPAWRGKPGFVNPVSMRWALALPLLLLALGCEGGQTGEITQLSECERVVARVPIVDLPQDARVLLASATASREAELRWDGDGAITQVEVEASLESETADRIGPGSCASILRVPASVHLATRDERLDVTVDALIDLAETEQLITIQGGAAAASLNGRDQLEDSVEVWLWMEQQGGERTATLTFDGAPAASF